MANTPKPLTQSETLDLCGWLTYWDTEDGHRVHNAYRRRQHTDMLGQLIDDCNEDVNSIDPPDDSLDCDRWLDSERYRDEDEDEYRREIAEQWG